jgi:hypothetical protein
MGYFYAGIAVVIISLGLACTYLYQRSEIAVLEKEKAYSELQKAVDVNKQNSKTISTLKQRAEQESVATEKEIARSQERDQAIDQIRKDMDNVEGANAPAGSYWDAFSERLQHAKRNH